MTLIKSISGIRGTIGGLPDSGLTPIDIVKFTSAYAAYLLQSTTIPKVVVGRDARISGPMVSELVIQTLIGMGVDVIDAGLSTTPTIEMAVVKENAAGGIIITASHNPKQWNALKLLNNKGEFISAADGQVLMDKVKANDYNYADIDHLGKKLQGIDYIQYHIDQILLYPLVNKEAIGKANFHVIIDAVNSTGGIAVPRLLEALGVNKITTMYCEPTGHFPHNPEPLPEHLTAISDEIIKLKAHVGLVVDPDVDRLAIVCEDGSVFGEEYTLVAVADYVLKHRKGNTVSNLSSTMALKDVTIKAGGNYFASAVGEVNVVAAIKEVDAVIGGEGNGGIILPDFHYGRDAMMGIALFLSHLALSGKPCSLLKSSYPYYHISKSKIELDNTINLDQLLEAIKLKYANYKLNTIDGIKIELDQEWVHIRRSNTEPLIRIYAESTSEIMSENLIKKIKEDIRLLFQS